MAAAMTRDVVLLMGGWSPEREVSLSSGRECAKALRDRGYRVRVVDVMPDLPALLRALEPPPDVVFNALHGKGGEDGTVQGVLDMLRIPYTHSGVLASALAMHKPTARTIFVAAGLPVPEGLVVPRPLLCACPPLPAPFVIKPVDQGSTVGVRIVRVGDNSWREELRKWQYNEKILVERYIPGRELTVAVMGERALGVCEIIPRSSAFYDYTAKYSPGGSDHLTPAPIATADYESALDIALRAHRALGCRGISRADFRYDDTGGDGRLYLLEINTQPGMTPTSLVPDIARHAGIGFEELVAWLVENAACDG
jgi:D-alanine-D-alanine ligase